MACLVAETLRRDKFISSVQEHVSNFGSSQTHKTGRGEKDFSEPLGL